ncbi:MAG: ATP-binding protein [Pseudomonadota bacterium]
MNVFRTPKILLVIDAPRTRNAMSQILEAGGYEVIISHNLRAALKKISQGEIDLALMGTAMSTGEAIRLYEILFEKCRDTPIIIITEQKNKNDALSWVKKGAYDFITIPFQIDQLLLSIKRGLEKRRLNRTERVLADEVVTTFFDLNVEKEKLKTIIHSMPNGLVLTNRNLEVVMLNPAFIRMMGISEEVTLPIPIAKIVRDEALIKTLERFQKEKTLDNVWDSHTFSIGETFLRAISVPVPGVDRNVFWSVGGTVTIFEDITTFKQLDQMKSDFIHLVVHELRSPLVSIRQLNTVLLEGLAGSLEEKQKSFIQRGIKKIDGLLVLINDLLDMAKVESAKHVINRVPVQMERIIEEITALMEPRSHEKGITLRYSCRDLSPIRADPKNMEELLNNLITNAINYSLEGGVVNVTAEGKGKEIEIKVEDRGIGIAEEELPKIFDKFYRVKNPKARQVVGSGLGLSIVGGIVQAHDGTIEVKSVVDKGTTFAVRLPMM